MATEPESHDEKAVGRSNWLVRLQQATTQADLNESRLCEIVEYIHIIVGDGGICMCGIYDGKAMTCVDILKQKSPEVQTAMIEANMLKTHGGTVWRTNVAGELPTPAKKKETSKWQNENYMNIGASV